MSLNPVIWAWFAVASGADQEAPGSDAATADQPEAIIVTAQRRPERSQEIPISLTAKSGEELERMQATDMARLGQVVPSLTMTRTGPFTQPYLRGIGKRSTLGVENSVATYVDGVYLASSISALLDLRGIERVEVLNGPQGTLFGRNATGGVIHVVTRDPEQGFAAEAGMDAGTYGYARGHAYLTGGSTRLAGSLAVSLSRHNGFGTNFFTGKKSQGELDHGLVVRSKVTANPAAWLNLTLAADYQDLDQDFAQLPVDGFPPVGEPRVQGFRDGDQDASTRYHFHYGGASIKAEAEVGSATLMSLTAQRRMRARYGTDLDMGPNLLVDANVRASQEQFSQELQLRSGESSQVRWIAGLYYIAIDERYDPTRFRYGGSYSDFLGGRILQTLFSAGDVRSYAAYGQATVPVGASTHLTGGLRYTIETRSIEANGERLFDSAPLLRPVPGLPILADPPLRSSETFRKLTWRLSLDKRIATGAMGYAAVSRGFQSGGWNLQTPQLPAFGPETVDSYEAGLKFANRSGSLNLDSSVFYYDYSDLQVSAITPIGSATINATSADIYGLGLQLDARPSDRSHLSFGGQLLSARYDDFPNATCVNYSPAAAIPYAPISCDVSRNALPFAPELKFNIGGSHRIDWALPGSLTVSANLAYNAGYFSEPDNVVEQGAFTTLDAALEWHPAQRGPSLRLWAQNLTGSEYYDSLVTFPTTGVLQRPAAPRRLGFSIGYSY
jgi:iron complex outermembrane receptor protein